MQRVTIKNLRALADTINRETGSPTEYCDKGQPFRSHVGHYHVDSAYGAYALHRVCNESGGVNTILQRDTARGLYEQMHAWLQGYRAGKVTP